MTTKQVSIIRISARTAAKYYNWEVMVDGVYLGTVPTKVEAMKLAGAQA